MTKLYQSVAAATAVVGYDLLRDNRDRQKGYTRRLTALRLTGSAAAGDTLIDLFIGDDRIGTFALTNATVPGNLDDMQSLDGVMVGPGEIIHAFVVDAPATNPVILEIWSVP